MPRQQRNYRWWAVNVLMPLVGTGGLASIIALFSHSPEPIPIDDSKKSISVSSSGSGAFNFNNGTIINNNGAAISDPAIMDQLKKPGSLTQKTETPASTEEEFQLKKGTPYVTNGPIKLGDGSFEGLNPPTGSQITLRSGALFYFQHKTDDKKNYVINFKVSDSDASFARGWQNRKIAIQDVNIIGIRRASNDEIDAWMNASP